LGEAKKTPPALSQHRAVTWALVLGLSLLMLSGAAGRAGADSTVGEFIPRQVIIKVGTSGACDSIFVGHMKGFIERRP
jgi:hypothetical protein